jgi:hypothetical protein
MDTIHLVNRVRIIFMLIALIALVGVTSKAQTLDNFELRIYASGATTPSVTSTSPASAIFCNQTMPATPAVPPINPRFLYWVDPVNAGKACRWDLGAGAGSLLAKLTTAGIYSGRLVSSMLGQPSIESTPATFERVVAPPAPSGLVFSQ